MPRLLVAVIKRDGEAVVVNAGRPASLVAFSDAHDGKVAPESVREVAWVVHHALGVEEPLDDWLQTLEDVSPEPADVALARRIIAGDEEAKAIALGERAPEEDGQLPPPPSDPAAEQLETASTGGG